MGLLARRARADLEIEGNFVRAVDEVVPIAVAAREDRGVACAQQGLANIVDQDELALEKVD